MATTPVDRYLFAQGNKCFFCSAPLSRADATVEHLVASSRGGTNSDDNCVACCKSINTLLGSMSLKEKIKVCLNQNGSFKCPNKTAPKKPAPAPPKVKKTASVQPKDPVHLLIANLKARSKARPTTFKSLTADIKSQKLARTNEDVAELIEALKAMGILVVNGSKVSYKL